MRLRGLTLPTLLLALLSALAPTGVSAQGATTGSIRGQVVSGDGAPVASAQVTVRNTETGLTRRGVTDAQGRYALLLLPSGTYAVEVSALGFSPVSRTARVAVNQATALDLSLAAQAVALEGVTVTAGVTGVDVARGGVQTTVGAEQLANLPVAGRDFTDFLNLSPLVSPQPQVGTGGQFSVGGLRTSGTNIQVDGADANNIFFGENRGSSRTPFAFSLESIREFQLITNGFDVEYGNYQGGVMNAVTRGGTNELEGSLFYFRRGEALTGNDFFGNPPADYQSSQFGFSLSGPLVRDRLHFFVSADGQRRDQPFYAGDPGVAGLNPDSVQRFFSILQSRYGLADPQRFYGQYSQDQNNLALFGRLDWTISDDHRLTVRQNYTDFEQTNDRVGTREALTSGGAFQDQVYSTVAELNSTFGNAFNTLRFQYSDEDRPRPANDEGGYLPQISVTLQQGQTLAFGGDAVLFRNRLVERKLQLIDNFTVRAGAHTFKLGTNNILSHTENTFWNGGNGSYSFNSLRDFQNGTVNVYSRSTRACPVALQPNERGEMVVCPQYDVPMAAFDVLEWSVYGQDEWQATDNLLVTGGLRYGGTRFGDQPGRLADVESAFNVATGVVPSFQGLSPRLSFAYDIAGGEQVLRGGVGYLLGRAPAVLAGNVFQTEKVFRRLECSGATAPTINIDEWLRAEEGQRNPLACRAGAGTSFAPEYAIFSDDFSLPKTLKSNIGYEGSFWQGSRLSLDFIYITAHDNYIVQDLNLRDQVFALANELGRPVFVPAARLQAGFRSGARQSDRARNAAYERVYFNDDEAEARAFNVNLELQQELGERFRLGASYGYNRASDNSSFSCCTSFDALSSLQTAGSPNVYGDPGDRDGGTWGPTDFERRHVVVANFLLRAPFGFNLNGIWRSQSGTPWTPVVDGDINGDGFAFNDRATISRSLRFRTPDDQARFAQLLDQFECLAEQEGRIARRNSCRNPWWHSLDMRLSKNIPTVRGQQAELLVDVFNVLNAINEDWGRFVTTSGSATNLIRAETYDAASGQVVYSTNYFPDRAQGARGFGEARPLTFGDPFQFQVQLGVRYRF